MENYTPLGPSSLPAEPCRYTNALDMETAGRVVLKLLLLRYASKEYWRGAPQDYLRYVVNKGAMLVHMPIT